MGRLVENDPKEAAKDLQELFLSANGNGRLVASVLGISERQLGRWIKKLREAGVFDLRKFRDRVRDSVPGHVYLNSRGRTEEMSDEELERQRKAKAKLARKRAAHRSVVTRRKRAKAAAAKKDTGG